MLNWPRELFIWGLLALAAWLDCVMFAFDRHLSMVDYTLLASFLLCVHGRYNLAFIFVLVSGFFRDSLLMPFFGINVMNKALTTGVIVFMCSYMERNDFNIRIIIAALSSVSGQIIYGFLAWIFYWKFKDFYLPVFDIAIKAAVFTLAAMVSLKLMQIAGEEEFGAWLKRALTYGKK